MDHTKKLDNKIRESGASLPIGNDVLQLQGKLAKVREKLKS